MRPHQRQLVALVESLTSTALAGAEVGVLRGETSRVLLKAFPGLFLYLVDPWATYPPDHPYRLSGDRASKRSGRQQDAIAELAAQNTEFARLRRHILREASPAAAERIGDRSLDFVFLDADHTEAAVGADLKAWYPKLRSGGLLCGHDYGHRRERTGRFGVRRAVNEFAEAHVLDVSVGEGNVWWIRKPPPRVCVIVPVYGLVEMTHNVVSDLRREAVEILIVDNQGDYRPLADERVLRMDENLGWAGGCNAGLESAARDEFEAFVIMNNDVRLARDHVSGLYRAWRDTGGGLIGPVLNFKRGPQKCRTQLDEFVPRRRHRPAAVLDGVSLLIPRSTYESVGPLDAERLGYLCYNGHVDYSIRSLQKTSEPNYVTLLSLLIQQRTVAARSVMPRIQRRRDVQRGEQGAVRKYGRTDWRKLADERLTEILDGKGLGLDWLTPERSSG